MADALVPAKAPSIYETLVPFRHQEQMIRLPWERSDINQLFLLGGYSSAKTTTLSLLTLEIVNRYWKYPVVGALMAPTITFLEKTLVGDLLRILKSTGSQFRYNSGKHLLHIGQMEIRLLASGQPSDIYGHNLSFCLSDEHDENPQEKAIEANTAMQERVRIGLPDGRQPFSVIATTAQGLKGVYRVVEAIKESKEKYALVRGRTRDNTALAPGYVEKLEALYTEEEREAFLEGKFVNLTVGRVYYAYDESKHFTDVQPVRPHETVHIGQDLNEGYSKGTAGVIRNGRIEIVAEWSFKAIGHAPEIMRQTFPHNRIIWYPDNSGKPILNGYVDEIEQYGIETVYAGRNPQISERHFFVNKLLMLGRMVVSKTCKDTSMALKTRQFDEKGVPEKGKGPTANDHRCFRGDMRVATEFGPKRIDSIVPGERVWTRTGLRTVLGSGMTGMGKPQQFVVSGQVLWATSDHPIITANRGKVPIDELIPSDISYTIDLWKEKPLSSMERRTIGIQEHKMAGTSSVERTGAAKASEDCIETYGSSTMDQSQPVMTSTTKTKTRSTMTSQTSNVCQKPSTIAFTGKNGGAAIQRKCDALSMPPSKKLPNGTEVQKGGHGIGRTSKIIHPSIRLQNLPANNAARPSLARSTNRRFVLRPVSRRHDETLALMTKIESVSIAARYSESVGSLQLKPVAAHALQSNDGSTGRLEPVYNLTVDGEHEYFVQGILVSNCDSVDYLTYRLVIDEEEFMDIYELSPAYHTRNQ